MSDTACTVPQHGWSSYVDESKTGVGRNRWVAASDSGRPRLTNIAIPSQEELAHWLGYMQPSVYIGLRKLPFWNELVGYQMVRPNWTERETLHPLDVAASFRENPELWKSARAIHTSKVLPPQDSGMLGLTALSGEDGKALGISDYFPEGESGYSPFRFSSELLGISPEAYWFIDHELSVPLDEVLKFSAQEKRIRGVGGLTLAATIELPGVEFVAAYDQICRDAYNYGYEDETNLSWLYFATSYGDSVLETIDAISQMRAAKVPVEWAASMMQNDVRLDLLAPSFASGLSRDMMMHL